MAGLFKYDPLHHQQSQNYLVLLITLVLLILLPPIAALFNADEMIIDLTITAVIITGIYITTDTRTYLRIGLMLGILTLLLRWLCLILWDPGWWLMFGRSLTGLLFFSYITFHLARSIIKSGANITLNTIYGAVAGYMFLGLISGQLFVILDLYVPDSIHFDGEGNQFDYMYFSYVILTGIGFGDIVPAKPIAKSLSVLIGIMGQVYLTVLIAILIGKYLTESNNIPNESN